MKDLLTAVALIFVVEGIVYALFPIQMQRALLTLREQPASMLRAMGLAAAILGVAGVWAIRH